MPSTSYPVHEPVQEPVAFLRSSLESVYVVSHEGGKLFHLKDLTMTEEKLPEECEPGWVVTKNAAGVFEDFELDDSVKEQLTEDPELIAFLNKMIVDSCTGKTNYDVAWWVGGFNNFMAGFCNRHYNF
jgi:hypothetical protein